jgi:hypothetical protein
VKEECQSRLILFGEASLKRALQQYLIHYHAERNHQGKNNKLLIPRQIHPLGGGQRLVQCHQRLGGMLKYYSRQAA